MHDWPCDSDDLCACVQTLMIGKVWCTMLMRVQALLSVLYVWAS